MPTYNFGPFTVTVAEGTDGFHLTIRHGRDEITLVEEPQVQRGNASLPPDAPRAGDLDLPVLSCEVAAHGTRRRLEFTGDAFAHLPISDVTPDEDNVTIPADAHPEPPSPDLDRDESEPAASAPTTNSDEASETPPTSGRDGDSAVESAPATRDPAVPTEGRTDDERARSPGQDDASDHDEPAEGEDTSNASSFM